MEPSHFEQVGRVASSDASVYFQRLTSEILGGLTPSLPIEQELDVKVRSSVKPICEHCKVIKRQGVTRIICKRNPKHKQKQG